MSTVFYADCPDCLGKGQHRGVKCPRCAASGKLVATEKDGFIVSAPDYEQTPEKRR